MSQEMSPAVTSINLHSMKAQLPVDCRWLCALQQMQRVDALSYPGVEGVVNELPKNVTINHVVKLEEILFDAKNGQSESPI